MNTSSRILASLALLLVLIGCATTIPKEDQDMLTQRIPEILGDYKGQQVFMSYPSVGSARDAVFMSQRKTTGRPTQAGTSLAHSLASTRDREICFTIAGASSARTAYIVKEAFSLINPDVQFPKLSIIFMGESEFESELRSLVEQRGAKLLFSEYTPPVRSQ